jgi:hypothetical protein
MLFHLMLLLIIQNYIIVSHLWLFLLVDIGGYYIHDYWLLLYWRLLVVLLLVVVNGYFINGY